MQNLIHRHIEEQAQHISAFEFKYAKMKARKPQAFFKEYPHASFSVLSKENYVPFII